MAADDPPTERQLAYAYDLVLKLTKREQVTIGKKISECKTTKEMSALITNLRRQVGP